MRIMTIASGSSGNCIYVGNNDTHILIDAGVSKKKVEEGLSKLDLKIDDMNAVLVTHEHSDHIQGLGVLERKSPVPIYATWGTINGIKNTNLGRMPDDIYNVIDVDQTFEIGSFKISAVRTSHDAYEPCAYKLTDGRHSFGLLTDLGTYDDYIVSAFKGLDNLLIEANHDIRMLQTGPYPYPLKMRILGDKGHLSNEASGSLINQLLNDNLNNIILGHLSKENNYPDIALETVRYSIDVYDSSYKATDFDIDVAKRDIPGKIISL